MNIIFQKLTSHCSKASKIQNGVENDSHYIHISQYKQNEFSLYLVSICILDTLMLFNFYLKPLRKNQIITYAFWVRIHVIVMMI